MVNTQNIATKGKTRISVENIKEECTMRNPLLAYRYAKTLLDEAGKKEQLEAVGQDVQYLLAICRASTDFVDLLKNPLVPHHKKDEVLKAITAGNICALTTAFLSLVFRKKREPFLIQILESFIRLYNEQKNIHTVRLITAVPVSEELRKFFVQKMKRETGLQNIALHCAVDEDLIGGFVLEWGGKQMDASLKRGLQKMRQHFNLLYLKAG